MLNTGKTVSGSGDYKSKTQINDQISSITTNLGTSPMTVDVLNKAFADLTTL